MLGSRKGFYHHFGLSCKDSSHQSFGTYGHFTIYDDRLAPITKILHILGANHEVSAKGTSIGIAKFVLELKTLTLIMFSNLYQLTNIGFINLQRVQFLHDLIKGTQIEICAHIFQTMGKTVGCSVT